MLVSHRQMDAPDLRAALATHAWIDEHFRVHLVRNANVVCEDDLVLGAIDRRGAIGRPVLTIVLAGRARLRVGDGSARWLLPGDAMVLPRKASVRMRQEGDVYSSIAVEWDPSVFGHAPTVDTHGRFPARVIERIQQTMGALATHNEHHDAHVVGVNELFGLVRAGGLPITMPEPGLLRRPVPAADLRLSRVLDELLSNLATQPMGIDFERALDVSPRHLTRTVSAFNARYGFNAGGWRDTLLRRRLTLGAALMCARGATVEGVARRLGYSSAAAFAHAFANMGLPSPGEVARTARALG